MKKRKLKLQNSIGKREKNQAGGEDRFWLRGGLVFLFLSTSRLISH